MNLRIVLLLFCALFPSLACSAPLKLRPLSGIGFMNACQSQSQSLTPSAVTLYREPGVGRITDLDVADIPLLSAVLRADKEKQLFAVTRRKGEWVRIVYDEAGREGWFVPPRQWSFYSWDRFFRGREVKPVPGLKKEYLQLYAEPTVAAPVLENMDRDRRLRVLDVSDNWMLVLVDMSRPGWFRWKDDDGRFLVSVE
jgi:hypothetical protein